MKKNSPRLNGPALTPGDVEHIAYTSLRDSAKLFPKSIDDLETLESELAGGADLPKPDTKRLLRMLRGELPRIEPKLPLYGPEPVLEFTESLALAARNGKKISDELRAKMDADRAAAEAAKKK
jgi:hypothetical protein